MGELHDYKRLRIEITGKCNLKCKYCYNSRFNQLDEVKNQLTLEEIKKIIKEAFEIGIKEVYLIGGEPFMHPNIFEIMDYIHSFNGKISISSNGTLLNERIIEKMKKYDIKTFAISLDGKKSHDEVRINSNHKQIINAIKLIRENLTKNVDVITIVNNYSKDELLELYQILKELKIREWALNHMFSEGRFKENKNELEIKNYLEIVEIYIKLLKEYFHDKKPFKLSIHNVYNSEILTEGYDSFDISSHPCEYYFLDSICMKPSGDVVLCPNNNNFKVNIREFDSLPNAMKNFNDNSYFKINCEKLEDCKNCRYLHLCGGGCRSEAKRKFGYYLFPDPISCIFMQLLESKIIPILPIKERESYTKLIKKELNFPLIKGVKLEEAVEKFKKIKEI
ncbi:radical SAM protein [archaeon]|nr:radical SAM protein [archaeon]